MTVKMSGAEYRSFMNDRAVFPENAYWEDYVLEVNGEELGEDEDDGGIKDADVVRLIGGCIILDQNNLRSPTLDAEKTARKWLKSLSTIALTLEIAKDDAEAFKALVMERFPKIRWL